VSYAAEFLAQEPTRAEVDATDGRVLVEFGTSWCPHCQRAQAPLAGVLAAHPEIRHLKVEDGKGRPLGRSFAVKLWPTLVLLERGRELARVVRPVSAADIAPLFVK